METILRGDQSMTLHKEIKIRMTSTVYTPDARQAPHFLLAKEKKKGRKREGNHRFPCAAKKTCARVLLMSPNMHQGNRGTVLTSLLQTGVRRVNNRVSIG